MKFVALFEVRVNNYNLYLIEYLNSLDLLKLPSSNLHLKVGCPIMLFHNIVPKCELVMALDS